MIFTSVTYTHQTASTLLDAILMCACNLLSILLSIVVKPRGQGMSMRTKCSI